MTALVFDRELLWRWRDRNAGRAAASLRDWSFLLDWSARDFAERLSLIRRTFPVCLCLGAGSGAVARALDGTAGIELMISAERAPRLAAACPRPALVMDEEALALRPGSLDAIVSPLALTTVNDVPGVLIQARAALKADGLLLASVLGPATLQELREALIVAETELAGGAGPRVAPFADVREIGTLLQRAGFALPVVDSETLTVTYPTALHLMRDLRAMGAANALLARPRRPLTRGIVARAAALYAERFAAPHGRVRASFEIVTMTAWAPHPAQPQPLRPGSATARLADALGVAEGHPPDPTAGTGT